MAKDLILGIGKSIGETMNRKFTRDISKSLAAGVDQETFAKFIDAKQIKFEQETMGSILSDQLTNQPHIRERHFDHAKSAIATIKRLRNTTDEVYALQSMPYMSAQRAYNGFEVERNAFDAHCIMHDGCAMRSISMRNGELQCEVEVVPRINRNSTGDLYNPISGDLIKTNSTTGVDEIMLAFKHPEPTFGDHIYNEATGEFVGQVLSCMSCETTKIGDTITAIIADVRLRKTESKSRRLSMRIKAHVVVVEYPDTSFPDSLKGIKAPTKLTIWVQDD